MSASASHRNYRVVYAIVERREKKYWTRVGAAFENQDGSINLILDAIPLTGDLQIRDAQVHETADSAPRSARGSR